MEKLPRWKTIWKNIFEKKPHDFPVRQEFSSICGCNRTDTAEEGEALWKKKTPISKTFR
jgi:hypothetical protein